MNFRYIPWYLESPNASMELSMFSNLSGLFDTAYLKKLSNEFSGDNKLKFFFIEFTILFRYHPLDLVNWYLDHGWICVISYMKNLGGRKSPKNGPHGL